MRSEVGRIFKGSSELLQCIFFIFRPLHAAHTFQGKLGRVVFLSKNNDHVLIKISRYNPSDNLLDDFNFSACRSNSSPVFESSATLLVYEVSLTHTHTHTHIYIYIYILYIYVLYIYI